MTPRWLGWAAILACALAVSACREKVQPLPVLGAVPQLSLVDQANRQVTLGTLRGRPWLADFFFTRCPSVCPRVTARMKEIRARVPANELRLVSISVDPENDTPAVLSAYAAQYAIRDDDWWLLTGDHHAIANAAENGFHIGLSGTADPSKPDFGITHGSHLILVDATGRIRGYYRSFDDDVIELLVRDLARLEEKP
jgi:protein SCO1/2